MTFPLLLWATIATTPIDQKPEPLRSLVTDVRRAWYEVAQDQFARRSGDPSMVGARFDIVVPGQQGNSGPISVDYDGRVLRVKLSPYSAQVRQSGAAETLLPYTYLSGVEIGERRSISQHIGRTAYGVRAKFETLHVGVDALVGQNFKEFSDDAYSVEINGVSAKLLASGLTVRLIGRISKLPDGNLGDCKSNYVAATLSSPKELYLLTCYTAVTFDRIELTDGMGHMLKAWTFI